MEWLRRISDYTNQLADTVERSDRAAVVPTCPEWTLADLTWHMIEVQDFWTWIITNRPAGPEEYVQPQRPSDDLLSDQLRSGCTALVDTLGAADPSDEAWSWSTDHTVRFTYRRQAHEAFIHLADAALATAAALATTVALPTADSDFALDGIEEFLSNNIAAEVPGWSTFTPDGSSIRLVAADADADWTLNFGRFAGTSPSGKHYDDDYAQRADADPESVVRGDAATLYLWLWGRAGEMTVEIEGDTAAADRLRAIASEGSQ